MSVTGTNFSETDSDKQVIAPQYLTEFKAYLRDAPPKVIVVYQNIVPDPNGPPLNRVYSGMSFPNMDFNFVKGLKFFKDELEANYEKVETFVSVSDKAIVFVRRPPDGSA